MIAYTTYTSDGRVRLEAESLVDCGYEVCILVPKGGDTPRTFTLCGVTVMELNVRKFGGKKKLSYLRSYMAFLGLAFLGCTRLFIRSGISIVHVHNMPDVLVFAGLIPRLFSCKLVLDIHDTVPETYAAKFATPSRVLSGILRFEERACCSFAHKIICVNHVQRGTLIKRGIRADKIATVITMPRFPALTQPSNEQGQAQVFRVVNHGTISKRLGVDLIVQATAKLVHDIPGFELHIIGGGDDLDELIRLSESLGLTNHVHFHSAVPWNKLPEVLRMMDVGIVANRVNEATELMLPSKLIDYVVLGIPAVVPRLGAIEYYFSEEMVSYYEAGDVDSMIAAIISIYKDPVRRERQPQKAKQFQDKYGWENHQCGLRELYDEL